jgi:single-strand DNA-binding protein
MNIVILLGRLTHQPELKSTNSGSFVCSFRIAVERKFKDSNGNKQTDFFNITAWKKTGELVAQYFAKGQQILVQGELQTRQYEDKNGNKRDVYEIIAENVSFVGNKEDNQRYAAPPPPAPQQKADPATYQQQSMIPGQRGATYTAPQQDFEEIGGDDLPF